MKAVPDQTSSTADQMTTVLDKMALLLTQKSENTVNAASIPDGSPEGIFLNEPYGDLTTFPNSLKQYVQGDLEIFFPIVRRVVIILFNPGNIIYVFIFLLIAFYFQAPNKFTGKIWKTRKKHKKILSLEFFFLS